MLAPALLVAIPFLGGTAAAILFVDALDPALGLVAAACALLMLIAGTAAALLDDGDAAIAALVLGCALAGSSLGASSARKAYHPPLLGIVDRLPRGEPVVLRGVLREDAVLAVSGVSLTIDVTAVESAVESGVESGVEREVENRDRPAEAPLGGVRVSVGGALGARELDRWRAGRTIRAPAFLRRPTAYLNPGTPDDRLALARRGIVLVGSVKSAALVDVVREGHALDEAAAAIRAWTRARVSAAISGFDRKSAGVTIAVLIGDRSGLGAEDERRLQDAGTYHVIAISGGNIAILAVLALVACRVAGVPARAAAILIAAGLLFYGAVASGAASVARAVTVAVIVLAGRAMDHRGSSLNALAVAAVIGVAAAPVLVLDAGFILSFGATVGILLGVPLAIRPAAARSHSLPGRAGRRLWSAVATLCWATMCAEVVLAPVGATLFGRVPLGGVLLNLAAIPLMTVVQVAGLVVVATAGAIASVTDAAAWAAHLAASGLLRSARLVEIAPWLAADVRPPAPWLMASYYACTLGLLASRTRRIAAWLLMPIASVMLVGPHAASRGAVPPSPLPVRAVILDVGQGDATVLQLPGGRTLLVDAGGHAAFAVPDADDGGPVFDVGERVVLPAIRALGVSRLDAMVVTHGDPDHLGGVRGLLRRVPASSVWEGIPVPPHHGLRTLGAMARDLGMTWRHVQAGDVERFGEVDVRVLHPALPDWERQRVRNEDSIVLEVRVGSVSIILPGDIGREGEQAILPRLEPGRLYVLKAPHHGSLTSSTQELLDRLRPVAVIFSCGRDNRFGHPHPTVVRRYEAIGAEIFSTASDGAVFVESDGAAVEVRGWMGKRATYTAQGPR